MSSESQSEKVCEALSKAERALQLARHTVGEQDRAANQLRNENKRLREVLIQIRDSKHCSYEANEASTYGTGVADGHRLCSGIAWEALSSDGDEEL